MSENQKLLLVDDEPGLREAVSAYLEDEGFEIEVASNANQAWEWLQGNSPDLIISDVMMPQVNGYEFLKQLRDDPRFRSIPVIFLTARGMTSDRIQGYKAGCDAYLPKPFDPEELVAIVRNLLERRSVSAEAGGGDARLEAIAQEIASIKGMLDQRPGVPQATSPLKIELTPREQSVLDLVSQGLMNKEIASRLDTSVRNVEKYVSRLFSKTGTNSRTELVRFALTHGLTQ